MTWAITQNFFHGIIDNKLDDTLELQLANLAKDEIEAERDYEVLKNLDETISSSASDTYATMKSLPSGYLRTAKLYIGDDRVPYLPVLFENRERYKNSAHRFYVRLATSQYALCATGVSGTHRHFFTKRSDDITAASSTLWAFPTRFDPLIAFKMAELFYPIDTGEKVRSWDDRWAIQQRILHDGLVRWDARFKMDASKNERYDINISTLPDAIDTNA